MASILSVVLMIVVSIILPWPPKASAFIAQESCRAVTDLLFVVDVSASISDNGLVDELSFLQNVISKMKISRDSVQVGVILFGDTVHRIIDFNSYSDLTSLAGKLAQFKTLLDPVDRSATNTQAALQEALQCVTGSQCGMRPNAGKLVIVLTDGESTAGENALMGPANNLKHAHNTHVMAIGIGSGVDSNELNIIASEPRLVFTTPSFAQALNIVDKISTKVCEVERGTMPPPIQTCSTQLNLDLLIIQDISFSVGKRGWRDEMLFNRYLIEIFTKNNPGVRVALEWFNWKVGMSFCFNQHQSSRLELLQYFSRLRCSLFGCGFGATYTGLALKYAKQALTPGGSCGARPGVKKLVVFVTDGNPSPGRWLIPNSRIDWKNAAMELKRHATVISVGVGRGIDTRNLQYFASDPRLVFPVDDFTKLPYLVRSLTKRVCSITFG